jgi:hypothetical protein
LLRAARDRDQEALYDVALRTGLVQPGEVAPSALLEFVSPLVEPLRVDEFPFTRAWLRAQTARSSDVRGSAARTQRRPRIPVRHLLVQRVAAGTTGVLCLLGAPVPVRDEVETALPGMR